MTGKSTDIPANQPGGPLCRVLLDHNVDFVVIGGAAIQAHGVLHETDDLDTLFRATGDNIARLGQALEAVGAHARGDAAVRFASQTDLPELLRWDANLFDTRLGPLDCFRRVPAAWTYDKIRQRAEIRPVGGQQVPVACLRDLIAMKRAAGRPKDLAIIATLRRRTRQQAIPRKPADQTR